MSHLNDDDLHRARSHAWLSFMNDLNGLPADHKVSVQQFMTFMATHLKHRCDDIERTRKLQEGNRG